MTKINDLHRRWRKDADYKDAETELRAGDVVVFSSDGLAEAPAVAGTSSGDHLPRPSHAGPGR